MRNIDARHVRRMVEAIILLALFSLLQAVALSQELHRHCHKDADSPNHRCVVTQLISGQLLEPVASEVEVVRIWAPQQIQCYFTELCLPQLDWRLQPGRAPPTSHS